MLDHRKLALAALFAAAAGTLASAEPSARQQVQELAAAIGADAMVGSVPSTVVPTKEVVAEPQGKTQKEPNKKPAPRARRGACMHYFMGFRPFCTVTEPDTCRAFCHPFSGGPPACGVFVGGPC